MEVRIEIGTTPGPRRFMGLLEGRPVPVKIPRDRKILILGRPGTKAAHLTDYLVDHEVEAEHAKVWDDTLVAAADVLIVGQLPDEMAPSAAAFLKMSTEEYAALGPSRFVLHAGAYQCVVTLAGEVTTRQVGE